MTPNDAQKGITPSYRHIHLTPDELAQLSPSELLQALYWLLNDHMYGLASSLAQLHRNNFF